MSIFQHKEELASCIEEVLACQKKAESNNAEPNNESDGFFLYSCNYVVSLNFELQQKLYKRQSNAITIMSFYLLGAMAFVGPNFQTISEAPKAIPALVMVSLLFWAIAFIAAIFFRTNTEHYLIPGKADKLSYLPSEDDLIAYIQEKSNRYDAGEYFAKKVLEELGISDFDSTSKDSILERFFSEIKDKDDLQRINKNAWLASLVHLVIGQFKDYYKAMNIYGIVYLLFASGIACLLTSIGLLLFL